MFSPAFAALLLVVMGLPEHLKMSNMVDRVHPWSRGVAAPRSPGIWDNTNVNEAPPQPTVEPAAVPVTTADDSNVSPLSPPSVGAVPYTPHAAPHGHGDAPPSPTFATLFAGVAPMEFPETPFDASEIVPSYGHWGSSSEEIRAEATAAGVATRAKLATAPTSELRREPTIPHHESWSHDARAHADAAMRDRRHADHPKGPYVQADGDDANDGSERSVSMGDSRFAADPDAPASPVSDDPVRHGYVKTYPSRDGAIYWSWDLDKTNRVPVPWEERIALFHKHSVTDAAATDDTAALQKPTAPLDPVSRPVSLSKGAAESIADRLARFKQQRATTVYV